MVIAGLLVIPRPEADSALRAKLASLDWADWQFADEQGRWVVTLEAESTNELISRHKEIQALPGVGLAEMVEHYVGEESPAIRSES